MTELNKSEGDAGEMAELDKCEEVAAEVEEVAALCKHYTRRCYLVCVDCDKPVTCRLCHDEENMKHELDRHAVKEVVCSKCDERQKASPKCVKCETNFGKYVCLKCNLFDDNEKGQFHCDGCGLCRVGGRDKFFHCDTCGLCLAVNMKDTHKCVEKVSRDKCSVCCHDLHTSVIGTTPMQCGHLIHSTCYQSLSDNGIGRCPICLKSIGDKAHLRLRWEHVDMVVRESPMPPEYKDVMKHVICYDCGEKSEVHFHVVGMKCSGKDCGSYNTTEYNPPPPSQQ